MAKANLVKKNYFSPLSVQKPHLAGFFMRHAIIFKIIIDKSSQVVYTNSINQHKDINHIYT